MSRPFDEARYRALLEGLEVTVQLLSEVLSDNHVFRFDPEYFGKDALAVLRLLTLQDSVHLDSLAYITDGIHESLPFIENGPVKVLSAKHPKDNFIDTTTFETISWDYHNRNPRTMLRENDILLSTVGTIGNSAVVTKDILPANSDRHIGIIRLKDSTVSPFFISTFLSGRYGRIQSVRETTGNVQPNLFIAKIGQILLPRFSPAFETHIVKIIEVAYQTRNQVGVFIEQAEQTLLRALGLESWQPPEPLTYTRSSRDVFAAGRLDAEHFREKYYAARQALRRAGALEFVSIEDLLLLLTNGHTPLHHDLTVGEVPFLCAEHVSDFEVDYQSEKRILDIHHQTELARTALRSGDVLLTIKGRVGNAAIAEDIPGNVNINQDVALLRFNEKLPLWYVVAFLNSTFGKLQSEQMCTGAINPFLVLLCQIHLFDL